MNRFTWPLTLALLIALSVNVPAQGVAAEPADPKLKLTYTRLKFDRLLPAEAVQLIQETLQNHERAIPELTKLAQHERSDVRLLVAMLLGEYGDSEGGDALWKLLEDPSEAVRLTASGALIRLRSQTPISASPRGLRSPDPVIRALAAGTLHKISDKGIEGALIDVLNDDDERVRMEAARALGAGSCGTETAVPSLIPLLHDQSVLVRTAAAMSLSGFQDPSVVPALIESLKDPDWHVRARAIMSLSEIMNANPEKRPQITEALISKLQEDEYALVRDRAADALAFANDDRANAALVKAITSDSRDVRFHAARAIVTAKAVSTFSQLAEHRRHEDPEVRQKILEIFGAIGGGQEATYVEEMLDDADSNVRLSAVTALRTMQQRTGTKALSERMTDPNPHVRAAAARAVGDVGDKEAVSELITLLRDPNGFVRGAAAEALGKLGDRTAVAPLLTVLAGERPVTGAADEQGLVLGTGSESLPEAIRQKRLEEKIQVVQALGALRSPEAVDPIVEHGLRAEDAGLRAESAVSLGKIGDVRAVDPLEATVRPYYEVAAAPADLEEGIIAGSVPENVRQIKEREARVRASVAWALGQLGDPATVDTLRRAVNDENSLVRDAATEALAKITERQERTARNPKPAATPAR